ncbi:MAG: hypothetical protein CME71_10255 [Halobacteriovorax sp.]|nr:hypothetical protein [Halobacteriovorax sp.]
MKTGKEIVITTPDYPPNRLGGLSTFSATLVNALESAGMNVNLMIWNKAHQLKNINGSNKIHIHSWPIMFMTDEECRSSINFIHAAELLPYSKNIVKRFFKKLNHQRYFRKLELAKKNIFISQFALDLACKYGYQLDVTRDVVFHNRIDLTGAEYIEKNISGDEIILCCFARDVPHKNIQGTIKFAEDLAQVSGKKVTLYCGQTNHTSHKVRVISKGYSDQERESIYKLSHLNLIFSLDHVKKGNIEGFGLTPLEAAKYGVPSLGLESGGLPESIHHELTGLVLRDLSDLEVHRVWSLLLAHYQDYSRNAYDHVMQNHSHHDYAPFIAEVVQ